MAPGRLDRPSVAWSRIWAANSGNPGGVRWAAVVTGRRTLAIMVACAVLMVGCGDDDDGSGTHATTGAGTLVFESSALSTEDVGAAGDDQAPGDEGSDGASDPSQLPFCDAVAALEVSIEEDEPALAAALEADTPAGLEEAVAVVREYTDRRQAGEDVFQDPDFLLVYNGAVGDLREHCGLD